VSTGNAADRVAHLFAGPEWLATLNAALVRNWWALAIRGFLGIAVGVIALVTPAAAMLALVLLFAAYVLVDGVFAIVAALRAARQHERWGWLILEGVADILAGTITVLWPGITVLAIVLLAAAWALVSGAFMTLATFRLTSTTVGGGLCSAALHRHLRPAVADRPFDRCTCADVVVWHLRAGFLRRTGGSGGPPQGAARRASAAWRRRIAYEQTTKIAPSARLASRSAFTFAQEQSQEGERS
jgi:uncharacterized membrane protein HdeD (DUF308 family)